MKFGINYEVTQSDVENTHLKYLFKFSVPVLNDLWYENFKIFETEKEFYKVIFTNKLPLRIKKTAVILNSDYNNHSIVKATFSTTKLMTLKEFLNMVNDFICNPNELLKDGLQVTYIGTWGRYEII